jgi:hypothetical protein
MAVISSHLMTGNHRTLDQSEGAAGGYRAAARTTRSHIAHLAEGGLAVNRS